MKKSIFSLPVFIYAFFIFVICTAETCGGTVDSDVTPCKRDNQGEIVFRNNTNEKRNFILNGVTIVSLEARGTSAVHLKPVGNYTIKVVNTFNLQDQSCANTIAVERCKRTTYSCPF